MQYRRSYVPGGTFFFTVVTLERQEFFCKPSNVALLRGAFEYVMKKHPFKIEAIVILPDHIHCLWTLPENDSDYSGRWRLVKSYFSHRCNQEGKAHVTSSRQYKQELGVWQRRFWEHTIRNESDFNNHIDYIHFNPVKHGLVQRPSDWKQSSFHHFVAHGILPLDWGSNLDPIPSHLINRRLG